MLTGLVVGALVLGGLTASPAQAATKAGLFATLNAATADYSATKPVWGGFPTTWRLRWRTRYLASAGSAARVRAAVSAASTPAQLAAAAHRVSQERTRAHAFRVATTVAATAYAARTASISTAGSALTGWLAGSLADASYDERRADAGAVAALAAADLRRAYAALGTLSAPAGSAAGAARPALTTGARATAPAGWIGVPGGCGLPAADASWTGLAGLPGVHLWVDDATVSQALSRTSGGDVTARDADLYLRRVAAHEYVPLTTDLAAVSSPLQKRSSRLGYAMLMGDATARSWVLADLRAALPPGPKAANRLRDAISLEALATELDWSGLDEAAGTSARRLREALLVRWLGPMSCLLDDDSGDTNDRENVAVVVDTSTLLGALALAPAEPDLSAALARSVLLRLRPILADMTADGGTVEGPSYWNLQARYLAAVYGTVAATWPSDAPVTLPDPSPAAAYAWGAVAADGSSLALGDSLVRPDPLRLGLVTWVAHTTTSATAGALVRPALTTAIDAYQVLWWPTDGTLHAAQPARASVLFPHVGLAALHAPGVTAWLHGGDTRRSHEHLDLGSVGYHRYGIQWAVDPGKGDYTLPGYTSPGAASPRWKYWKVSASGHSSLHPPTGQPPMRAVSFSAFSPATGLAASGAGSATLVTTPVMPGARSATRRLELATDGHARITDSVVSAAARSWTWTWVTDAAASVTGSGRARTVTLSRDGRTVRVALAGLPAGSACSVVNAPAGAVGPDGRRLRVVTCTTGATTRLTLVATVG